jgi:hypothetical protein
MTYDPNGPLRRPLREEVEEVIDGSPRYEIFMPVFLLFFILYKLVEIINYYN